MTLWGCGCIFARLMAGGRGGCWCRRCVVALAQGATGGAGDGVAASLQDCWPVQGLVQVLLVLNGLSRLTQGWPTDPLGAILDLFYAFWV